MRDSSLYEDFMSGRITGVYHGFFRPLMSFAMQYLGPEYDFLAEDVAQEAIFQTYMRKEQIKNPTALKSYLYHAVRNISLNILKKRNARLNYLKGFEESETDIMHRIIEEETFRVLFETIASLSPAQREVLDMSYFKGLKNAEVAQRLGISEIAVKKRKSKLIQELRKLLSDKGISLLLLATAVARLSSNTPS